MDLKPSRSERPKVRASLHRQGANLASSTVGDFFSLCSFVISVNKYQREDPDPEGWTGAAPSGGGGGGGVLTMSWQMYPMASSVDSFMCSVLDGSVTLATSWGMSSGHWVTGISAQAIPATHCEAELGRYVSVPRVCRTCGAGETEGSRLKGDGGRRREERGRGRGLSRSS